MTIKGTSGDDSLSGTAGDDLFKLAQGGDDEAFGKAGNDEFRLGTTFTAADSIFGGAGDDLLLLEGDPVVVFGADTMRGVETLVLDDGPLDLTLHDVNVGAGALLTVDAHRLNFGATLTFDGSAETDGRFAITVGDGDDNLVGGAKDDKFVLGRGGVDTANGGAGKDVFLMGATLTTSDTIVGGSGSDTVKLTGGNSITFSVTTMTGVEHIVMAKDAAVSIGAADATIAAGEILHVDGSACLTTTFTFSAVFETDGRVDVVSGGSAGTLTGGDLDDKITMSAHTGIYTILGRGGADHIICNTGRDQLRMTVVFQSSGIDHDDVDNFDAGQDKIDIATVITTVSTTSGSVNTASFDADLGTVIADSLAAGKAILVNVTGGDLIGSAILVIDGNGNTTYGNGQDFVLDITGFTGTLDTSDFI